MRSRIVLTAIGLIISSIVLSGCQMPWQKEKTAGLQITTEGATASVFLNNEYANKTPYIDKNLKAGTYSVRIEPEDKSLAPYETSIKIYPGTLSVMNWKFGTTVETSSGIVYEMEPHDQAKGSALSIISIPDGTITKVDEVSHGFTPVLLKDVTPGSHQILVSLPSYAEQKQSINVIEGYRMNVTVKLAKIPTEIAPQVTEVTESTESAQLATPSASTKPKATPTPTPKPVDIVVSSTGSASPKPTAIAQPTVAKPYVKVLDTPTGWLRVRDAASSTGKELAQLDEGATVKYFQTENGWHEVEYEAGKKGWVSGQYSEVVK